MSVKKIFTVAFEANRRMRAQAYFNGVRLSVVEMSAVYGEPEEWIPAIQKDIEQKVKDGWVCMVEDPTFSFPSLATSFNFDAMADNGRTWLQTALDWYLALDSRGGIVLGEGLDRYVLRQGTATELLDLTQDTKGRSVYSMDWQNFNAGHKALLMCVVGAVQEDPMSERWLLALGGMGVPPHKKTLWEYLDHLTIEQDKKHQREFQLRVEAKEEEKNHV